MIHKIRSALHALDTVVQKINEHANQFVHPYTTFGVFGIITYPFYYGLWRIANTGGYENLSLRLIVCLLCIPLILKNYWPKKLQSFLSLYWYFTLLYCLPFLFTFLLLKNNISNIAVMNTMTVLVLCILLLDIMALLIILPIGVVLGWCCYWLTTGTVTLPMNYEKLIIPYLSIIFFGALFAHRKERLQQEKLEAMKLHSANIAHELRTPLATFGMATDNLREFFPYLKQAYLWAKDKDAPLPNITTDYLDGLEGSLASMRKEIRDAFTFIDISLIKTSLSVDEGKSQIFLMGECIDEVLVRYPFDEKQRQFIQWEKSTNKDFLINADKLLIIHVLFNLLKNALYYIAKASKGNIQICLENGKSYNKLYFKDTGTGISKDILPHIFERFLLKLIMELAWVSLSVKRL